MRILNPDQVLAPCRGVLVNHASEAGFQLLVEAFGLAVGFGVITGCQASSSSNETTEFLPEPGYELGPPVGNNVFGKSVDTKNSVHHNLCRLFGRG